jgi:hypothetical protein
MDENIKQFLHDIKVGAKQSHKNMTLYCLLTAHEADTELVTMDEALQDGSLIVTETDEAGNVPELRVVNKSNRKVLMLDGEELVGAKQNRVLNVTILLGPNSETIVPVSCVEQGRWAYKSTEFRSDSRAMSPRLKRRKTESVTMNLDMQDVYMSDQGMVWGEIDAKYSRMKTPVSPTRAMSDLYDSHRITTEEYLKAFRPVDNQVGIIVFIDGELAGAELLGKFDTFRKSHQKLVQSYVMDALETADSEEKPKKKPSKAKTLNLLESTGNAKIQKRLSVALGHDVRLESDELFGAGLEHEGEVLQLTVFLKDNGQASGRQKAKMSRDSRRRDSLVR